MIGQYLSNTNKRATVLILQNILELNKALACLWSCVSSAAVLFIARTRVLSSRSPFIHRSSLTCNMAQSSTASKVTSFISLYTLAARRSPCRLSKQKESKGGWGTSSVGHVGHLKRSTKNRGVGPAKQDKRRRARVQWNKTNEANKRASSQLNQ